MTSDVRCWYLNQKGKATGPFAFSDIKAMSAQGGLKGHDLVFREGSAEWKRAYDWPELVECFSDENRSSLSRLIRLPEEERAVEDQWVLLVREDGEKEVRFRQKGPFQSDEIKRMLLEEKIKSSDHIWKKGAARWVPLYDVPEFHASGLKMTQAAAMTLESVQIMPNLPQIAVPEATQNENVELDLIDEKTALDFEIETGSETVIETVSETGNVSDEPKAQVFSPEITKTDSEIALSSPTESSAMPPLMNFVPFSDISPERPAEPRENRPNTVSLAATALPQKNKTKTPIVVARIPQESVSPVDKSPAHGVDKTTDMVLEKPADKAITKKPLSASVEAAAPKKPSEAYPYFEGESKPGWFHQVAPALMIGIVGVFGIGIWATMNTDRSVFKTSENLTAPTAVAVPEKRRIAEAAHESSRNTDAGAASAKSVAMTSPPTTGAESLGVEAPSAALPTVSATAPNDASPVGTFNPAADFDGKSPIVRVDAKTNNLEILGPFRKGELLRIRIEGRAGQILDLPALVQKFEVRARHDNFYSISLKETRMPKGDYLVSVQFGMSRFSRGVGVGKDEANFSQQLQGHRKVISYDQQQERKKLIRSAREFASLLNQAEAQVRDTAGLRKLQRELDRKAPPELKMVRSSRYELIFFDYWEKLAAQWDRVTVTMKDNPGRNPASVGEFVKAKKMAVSLENELRSASIWN